MWIWCRNPHKPCYPIWSTFTDTQKPARPSMVWWKQVNHWLALWWWRYTSFLDVELLVVDELGCAATGEVAEGSSLSGYPWCKVQWQEYQTPAERNRLHDQFHWLACWAPIPPRNHLHFRTCYIPREWMVEQWSHGYDGQSTISPSSLWFQGHSCPTGSCTEYLQLCLWKGGELTAEMLCKWGQRWKNSTNILSSPCS